MPISRCVRFASRRARRNTIVKILLAAIELRECGFRECRFARYGRIPEDVLSRRRSRGIAVFLGGPPTRLRAAVSVRLRESDSGWRRTAREKERSDRGRKRGRKRDRQKEREG